jgi:hypothetical protein
MESSSASRSSAESGSSPATAAESPPVIGRGGRSRDPESMKTGTMMVMAGRVRRDRGGQPRGGLERAARGRDVGPPARARRVRLQHSDLDDRQRHRIVEHSGLLREQLLRRHVLARSFATYQNVALYTEGECLSPGSSIEVLGPGTVRCQGELNGAKALCRFRVRLNPAQEAPSDPT